MNHLDFLDSCTDISFYETPLSYGLQQLKDEVGERYPGARRRMLKMDDFPLFLSRPDELTASPEAKPNVVQGISRNDSGRTEATRDDLREEHRSPQPSDGSVGGHQSQKFSSNR